MKGSLNNLERPRKVQLDRSQTRLYRRNKPGDSSKVTLNDRNCYNTANHKPESIETTKPDKVWRQQFSWKNFNLTALENLNQTYFRLTIFKFLLIEAFVA